MQALNVKEVELRDRRRRILPVTRRRMSRLWDIVSAWTWYQSQRLSRRKDPAWVPPSRLPPLRLRKRVNGLRDIYSFLEVGRRCAGDLLAALESVGRSPESFENVLDFGCGCGRTLMWLEGTFPNARLSGSDVDGEAVAWCQGHLSMAEFRVNEPLPPLGYPDESFDLIYVISLFTHFDEDSQFRWLDELWRLTRPGGIVLATFHGEYCWEDYESELVSELRGKGFAFRRTDPSGPPGFQTTYHSEEYVRERFGEAFSILEYRLRGLNRHQDMVVLEKPRER